MIPKIASWAIHTDVEDVGRRGSHTWTVRYETAGLCQSSRVRRIWACGNCANCANLTLSSPIPVSAVSAVSARLSSEVKKGRHPAKTADWKIGAF